MKCGKRAAVAAKCAQEIPSSKHNPNENMQAA